MTDRPVREETATLDGRPTAVDAEAGIGPHSATDDARYSVIGRLGKGGMGEVMLVRDKRIGREVALKRIRRARPSERMLARFLREASVQGRLEHPAIVPLYDLDHDASGEPFFTMKKLTGATLAKLLSRRGDYTLQRLLRAFADVCLAVELAHTRGIIHRDLKPDNIVLGDFGEVYVLDWGVAKIVGESDSDLGESESFDDVGNPTVPGTALGTPGYMAPEQVHSAADVDARADVYALGCILFEIVAHEQRHPRPAKAALASALDDTDVKPSDRSPDRTIPPELDELCVQAMAADRERRIATARELGERVQRYLDGDRDLATRRQLALAHLEAAQIAFASVGDDPQRLSVAMRQAASALALDPTLTGAAELVGRLMLEPPRTTPREVDDEILEEDVQTMRSHARVGVWLYVGFLAFTPLLWWIAPARSPYVLALSAMVACNFGLCLWGARSRPLGKEWLLAVSNTILLAIVAHMFTPFLIAPGMAAMSVLVVVLTPTRSRVTSAIGMCVLGCIAVLVPWVLERLGVLGVTTAIDAHGISLAAPALAGDEANTLVVGVLYVVGMIVGAAVLAAVMRTREHAARRRLHLQAWQLRQLVPR